MIVLSAYRGKYVAVFGLGKAGAAAVASFIAGGAHVHAWDDGEAARDEVAKRFGRKVTLLPPARWPWKKMELMCLSPGIPFTFPAPHPAVRLAQKHHVRIVGEVDLLYEACPNARYVGITGTNGKSTTTALIGHMLDYCGCKVQVGGNLGTPVLALEPLKEGGVYVVEMSSYQLDLMTKATFSISVLLNITPDHLDRHGGMEGYIDAKCRIFDRQTPDDVAIIAIDDDTTAMIASTMQARTMHPRLITVSAFGKPADVMVSEGIVHEANQTPVKIDLNPIVSLTGGHNWQNAAAAYAACRSCNIVPDMLARAITSFPGLPHRLQLITQHKNVRFFNDSKATNAEATACALAPFHTIYWIAGGVAKDGGIHTLERYFEQIVHAFLIGESVEEFAATLEGKVPYTKAATLEVATRMAAEKAFKDNFRDAVVMLSPACASFDQFKNFEHRGESFIELLRRVELPHAA